MRMFQPQERLPALSPRPTLVFMPLTCVLMGDYSLPRDVVLEKSSACPSLPLTAVPVWEEAPTFVRVAAHNGAVSAVQPLWRVGTTPQRSSINGQIEVFPFWQDVLSVGDERWGVGWD
jgi:hypothetical protein